MTAYYNIHGEQLTLSARDAVLQVLPDAVAVKPKSQLLGREPIWTVHKSGHRSASTIGAGASEESAWRDAWSRMLVESMGKADAA